MSYAKIDSNYILTRCAKERTNLREWLERVNGEYDKRHKEMIERWENRGWLYRLIIPHPDAPKNNLKDFRYKLNKEAYNEMIERIANLEALAKKSVDGHVLLSSNDANFLNITDD